MDLKQQINALARDLDDLVDQYRREWDLPYAAVTGILSMKIHILELEVIEIFNEQEEE